MLLGPELARLFHRDLTRLAQQIRATPDDAVWRTVPGVSNTVGNLALHIEGNLRDFIGRELGGIAYVRQRDREFDSAGLPAEDLALRIEETRALIVPVVETLAEEAWERPYPKDVLGVTLSTRQFVIHLMGHLNYHLGQADYLRRTLTGTGSLKLAGLS